MGIAFRPETETYTSPVLLLPRTLTLENFPLVFERLPEMLIYFRNSFIITGISVALVVLVSALGGYALSRLRFRGKTIIFLLVVASMYMPRTMAMPSLYQLLFRLRLIDTYQGLILPYVAWHAAITTVLMRSVFQSIPQDLVDSALIDGANQFRIFRSVMMPLAASATVTAAILAFVPIWGEFIFAFTFTQSVKTMPLSVAMALLDTGPHTAEWTFNVAAAAALIAFIPALVIYIALQRWFTKGVMEGALKF
jgi:ABC-type glycerol-3-phosphate transport system permease component